MQSKSAVILFVLLGLLLITGCSSSSSSSSSFEPRFAYVLNEDDPSVSWFRVNAETGEPRHMGYLYLGEHADSVFDMVLHPEGDALYVSDPGNQQIHIIKVDQQSGTLQWQEAIDTPDGSITQFPSDFSPYGLAISSDGEHLYSVLQSSVATVRIFSIDAEDHSLTAGAITGVLDVSSRYLAITPDQQYLYASLPTEQNLQGLALNPDGSEFEDDFIIDVNDLVIRDMFIDQAGERLVIAGSNGGDRVQVYAIHSDGTLEWLDGTATMDALGVTGAPDGQRLFVTHNGVVHHYSFDPDQNSLVMHGSLNSLGTDVTRAAMDPSGQFLFAGTSGPDRGHALFMTLIEDVSPEHYSPRFGSLAREGISRMVFSTGSPVSITASHLYVGDATDDSDLVDRFTLDHRGRPGDRLNFTTDGGPIRALTLHPFQDVLLSAHEGPPGEDNGLLMAFALDEQGMLQLPALDEAREVALDLDPQTMAVSSGGRHVYSAGDANFHRRNYDPQTREFGGSISPTRSFPTTAMIIDPAGRFLFEATGEDDGRIRRSTLDPEFGNTDNPQTTPMDDVVDVAITPDGSTLIAISNNVTAPEIVAWSVSAEDGLLTENNSRTLADPGVAVAIHPSGEWVYVVTQLDTGGGSGDSTLGLHVHAIDEDGQISAASLSESWTQSWHFDMRGVAVSPDGSAVYVATSNVNTSEGTLRVYEIGDQGDDLAMPQMVNTVNLPASLAIRPDYD